MVCYVLVQFIALFLSTKLLSLFFLLQKCYCPLVHNIMGLQCTLKFKIYFFSSFFLVWLRAM
uniref:Uncharacterized protein n=1 Tax=Anguilla anguilla TaxID=7936 RepID=A0A0E9WQJ7_ANGAN